MDGRGPFLFIRALMLALCPLFLSCHSQCCGQGLRDETSAKQLHRKRDFACKKAGRVQKSAPHAMAMRGWGAVASERGTAGASFKNMECELSSLLRDSTPLKFYGCCSKNHQPARPAPSLSPRTAPHTHYNKHARRASSVAPSACGSCILFAQDSLCQLHACTHVFTCGQFQSLRDSVVTT